MNEKANASHAVVNQLEALIAALKKERDGLERRLVLLRSQENLLNDASRLYFNLVYLKREAGLEILELPPVQRKDLNNLLGPDIAARQLQEIEDQLHDLAKKGGHLKFAEIKGILEVIDGIIEMLQKQKKLIVEDGKSELKMGKKKFASNVIRVCGGSALIALDLPVQNWLSVVGGSMLILTTGLDNA